MSTTTETQNSLFKMTWPLFVELFLQMLAGSADQFMLKSYNRTAVAAVGNANQVITLLLLTFTIISLATTILVTLYLGANDNKKVSQIYTLAIVVNIVLGFIISLIVVIFHKFIFQIMQVPQELMQEASIYIVIVAVFMPFQALFLTFSAIFRANTMMKKAMIAAIVVNLLNIGGNAVLINGVGSVEGLGAMGAAISTSMSRIIGVVLVIYMFKKSIKNATVSLKNIKPFPKELFKKLMFIGLPSAGETLSYNLSQIVILAFINTMGTEIITLKMYATMVAWFAYVFAMATSQSSQIMVGYLIGSGDLEGANQRTIKTFKCSAPVSVIITVIILIFSDQIFTMLKCSPDVLHIAKTIFIIELVLEFSRVFNMVFIRALQAAGDVLFPVVIGIGSQWFISVGIGFILGITFGFGLQGIWIAMALDETIRAIIFILRWKSGVWRRMSAL